MTGVDPAGLLSLVDLITTSVQTVIQIYGSVGKTVPSLYSTGTGPFDTADASTLELVKATQVIEAACAQLCASVCPPGHTVTNLSTGFLVPVCMRVAATSKISDILKGTPEGQPVETLARTTNIEPDRLARIMRLLSTNHCYAEVKPNVFANNRLSVKLMSTDPVSALIAHNSDEVAKGATYLYDELTQPRTGAQSQLDHSAFRQCHGVNIHQYYRSNLGRDKFSRFRTAADGWSEIVGADVISKLLPWSAFPVDTTLCSLSGGVGQATLEILRKFPHLKAVLQCPLPALEATKQYWTRNLPTAVHAQRVAFNPIDLFKDAPQGNCDIYYLRFFLHNWSDAQCIRILENIRRVMHSSSRVIIHEYALQHSCREPEEQAVQEQLQQAPEPLLANFGLGRVRLYNQDLHMMITVNGKERTAREYISLGRQAGLKFDKTVESGESSLLEFTLP